VGNIIGEGRSWCTTDVLGKGSCIIGIGGAGSMAVALPLFRFWSGAGTGMAGLVGAGAGFVGQE
jgi:hypothetical protein